jgi:hypothetical protein
MLYNGFDQAFLEEYAGLGSASTSLRAIPGVAMILSISSSVVGSFEGCAETTSFKHRS